MVLKNPLWTLLWTLFRCFARETSQHDTTTLSEVLSQCHPLGRRGPEKFHGNQREAKTRPPALPLPKLCLSVTPGTLRKAPSWVPFSSLISPLKDSQSVSPRQLRWGQKRAYQGRRVSKGAIPCAAWCQNPDSRPLAVPSSSGGGKSETK